MTDSAPSPQANLPANLPVTLIIATGVDGLGATTLVMALVAASFAAIVTDFTDFLVVLS